MELINQYSMLWGGIIIAGLATFVILRKGFKPKDGIKLLFLVIALVGLWLILRPQQASTNEFAEFQAQLGQGRAVLLELQSPY